ncbi:von Willebrand factor type A domain-containing protein [Sphingobacterium oryzagri]|uniref:von Willebrand factor type A domain-containing protein n=1 Tax=Sphingobacterium oryzagri TaxID=3025669 RepID=A0ABY7WMB9_9SPHI|nr:von Willebrand factor type A domain-containing protein [Sphingobacterium sp. KACC 22765]WDF69553.1 von Willebrand factor type A domain-containing protein [Sphingobacterium sp. KACC 22765]
MKKLWMLYVLPMLLLSMGMDASKAIKGLIIDRSTNTLIVGAEITNQRTKVTVRSDANGAFSLDGEKGDLLVIRMIGFEAQTVKAKVDRQMEIKLQPDVQVLEEVVVVGYAPMAKQSAVGRVAAVRGATIITRRQDTESYAKVQENGFLNPTKEPLSTFAADVDAASYGNVRRMLKMGSIPPQDAVRVEEMINYFQYDVAAPTNGDPVNITTEWSTAPWNTQHRLMRVTLKAKDVAKAQLPSSNFVFLIDVSGSMYAANKLPLVKSSLKMLVDQLRPNDRVAIVTYAGSAGVKLGSTSGDQKMQIKDAIDQLEAGGSTAGAAGLTKAYAIAKENFIKEGNNRIIMATDGDFNVGPSSDDDMESLIEQERQHGVHISLLGFGMGNYKDSKLEILADKGHGNYAYIDNISEARKAMITEFGATLYTVAKDVKIQVEFNPAYVQAYRLVGYENRLLEAADFNNDAKIGGDMGVGHTVTALYEIVPVGVNSSVVGSVDALKYQRNESPNILTSSKELATVKFRYKDPQSETSKLQQVVVENTSFKVFDKTTKDYQFAASVAEFGMLLRNSAYKQQASFDGLIARAKAAKGDDSEGYRMEFIRLAEDAKALLHTQR